LDGHSNWVNETAFSYDATQLASAADDETVKVWDVSSGSCLWTFRAPSHWVTSVAFSHDLSWLASASHDKTVKIWDLGSGECLKTLEGHSYPIGCVAFSHDSTQLASGSGDQTVKIWDADSGDCLQTLEGHGAWVTSVTFIHDSTQVASTSYDNTLKVWDVRRGECLLTLDTTGLKLGDISWDIDRSCIRTEVGDIFIGASPITKNATAATKPCDLQHRHNEPSVDGGWITLNHKRLMWLPPGYHPSDSTTSGQTIGIGVASGKVWMCKIKPDEV
jgi:WD40 repeat protein